MFLQSKIPWSHEHSDVSHINTEIKIKRAKIKTRSVLLSHVCNSDVSCDAVCSADICKCSGLDISMTCRADNHPAHVCVRTRKRTKDGNYLVFSRIASNYFSDVYHVANAAHLTLKCRFLILPFSSVQQVQMCVWDLTSTFRIVLVSANKVNADETAKVISLVFFNKNKTDSLTTRPVIITNYCR